MAYSLKSVFKGSSIYTAGQLLTKASAFFLIPLYTRFLTPADYGIIGYLNVFLSILTIVFIFGFHSSQIRYYHDLNDNPEKLGEFLFSINGFLIVTLVILGIVLTFWGEFLFSLLNVKDIPYYPYVPIVIWTAIFQILNQMIDSYYLTTKQYTRCALQKVVLFLLTVSFVIVFIVVYKEGALGKLKGVLFGTVIFFLIFYIGYARQFVFRFSFRHVYDSLAFGIPMVFHLLATNALEFIDRIILEKFVSLSELGLYTFGYQLGLAVNIAILSFNRAWSPNYYELMGDSQIDRAYHVRKAFSLWLVGVGTFCLTGCLWIKELLVIFVPQNFYPSSQIVPVILYSLVFKGLYGFSILPLFYFKKTKLIPIITVSSAVINVGLNLWLIPIYGIMGAAYATLISYIISFIFAFIAGKYYFDAGYEYFKIFILLTVLFGVGILTVFDEITLIVELKKISILIGYIIINVLFFKEYLRPAIDSTIQVIKKRLKIGNGFTVE